MNEFKLDSLMNLLKERLDIYVPAEEVKRLLETHGREAGRMSVHREADLRMNRYVVVSGLFGWAKIPVSRDEDCLPAQYAFEETAAMIYEATCWVLAGDRKPVAPALPESWTRQHPVSVLQKKNPDLSKLMDLLKSYFHYPLPEEQVRDLIEKGGRAAGHLSIYVDKRPQKLLTLVVLAGAFGWRSWVVTSDDDISKRMREAEIIAKAISETLHEALSDDLVRRPGMAIPVFDRPRPLQRPAFIPRLLELPRSHMTRQGAYDAKFNETCSELGITQQGCLDMAELFSVHGIQPIIELYNFDHQHRPVWVSDMEHPAALSVNLTKPNSSKVVLLRIDSVLAKNTPDYWEKVLNLVTTFILTKGNKHEHDYR